MLDDSPLADPAAHRHRHVLHHQLAEALGLEWQRAGDHLVEDHAERIDIGAEVDRLSARLFRRHVFWSADDLPRRRGVHRDAAAVIGADQLGDAEVEDLHEVGVSRALDQEDVVGLRSR